MDLFCPIYQVFVLQCSTYLLNSHRMCLFRRSMRRQQLRRWRLSLTQYQTHHNYPSTENNTFLFKDDPHDLLAKTVIRMSHDKWIILFLTWVPLERPIESKESNKEHKKQYDVEVLNFWRNFLPDQPVFQPFLRLRHIVKQFQASKASWKKVNSRMRIREDWQEPGDKQWKPIPGPGPQLVRYPFSLYAKDFPKLRKLQLQQIMMQMNLRNFKMVQFRSHLNHLGSLWIP